MGVLTGSNDECEIANSALFSRSVENSLEVDGEVVQEDEETAAETIQVRSYIIRHDAWNGSYKKLKTHPTQVTLCFSR